MSDRQPGRELHLGEDAAQALVLVQAVEEVDRQGSVIDPARRRQATTVALAEGSGPESEAATWLTRRADLLLGDLERQWPHLDSFLRLSSAGRGLLTPALVTALIAGLSSNALGPERQIHVLALPLAGILLWNLLVLALLLLRHGFPLLSMRRLERPLVLNGLDTLIRRQAERFTSRLDDDASTAAFGLYLERWSKAGTRLAATRLSFILHLSALTLLAGLVGGMYLRSTVLAYEATWESTFVDANTVDHVLGTVLAPAAAVLGSDVPSAAELERGRDSDNGGGGPAGPWIHLWAMTAFLFAGLPRLFLALAAGISTARASRRVRLEVSEVYIRRLLAAVSSSEHRVEVLPFSYRPTATVADNLRARLLDVFGAKAEIHLRSPIEYGTDPAQLELMPGRAWLLLFNLAQTPEVEVHGELAKLLQAELQHGQQLIVVVDSSIFKERVGTSSAGEKRLGERRRSWERLLADAGLKIQLLDLANDDVDTIITALLEGGGEPR